MQIRDLAKLITKLMTKRAYKWDFNKAKLMIEAYSSVNTLSKSELETLFAFIIFPFNFGKLGKRRYVKRKTWSEEKYIKKLNKIIGDYDKEEVFIHDFLNYLENYGSQE